MNTEWATSYFYIHTGRPRQRYDRLSKFLHKALTCVAIAITLDEPLANLAESTIKIINYKLKDIT